MEAPPPSPVIIDNELQHMRDLLKSLEEKLIQAEKDKDLMRIADLKFHDIPNIKSRIAAQERDEEHKKHNIDEANSITDQINKLLGGVKPSDSNQSDSSDITKKITDGIVFAEIFNKLPFKEKLEGMKLLSNGDKEQLKAWLYERVEDHGLVDRVLGEGDEINIKMDDNTKDSLDMFYCLTDAVENHDFGRLGADIGEKVGLDKGSIEKLTGIMDGFSKLLSPKTSDINNNNNNKTDNNKVDSKSERGDSISSKLDTILSIMKDIQANQEKLEERLDDITLDLQIIRTKL